MKILPTYGQANCDLVLMGYGSRDLMVKMAVDNNILDLNAVQNQVYVFDERLIKNANIVGRRYATEIIRDGGGGGAYSGAYSGAYNS